MHYVLQLYHYHGLNAHTVYSFAHKLGVILVKNFVALHTAAKRSFMKILSFQEEITKRFGTILSVVHPL